MKKIYLFFLTLLFAIGATAYTGTAPTAGNSYYLYNVGSGKFLNCTSSGKVQMSSTASTLWSVTASTSASSRLNFSYRSGSTTYYIGQVYSSSNWTYSIATTSNYKDFATSSSSAGYALYSYQNEYMASDGTTLSIQSSNTSNNARWLFVTQQEYGGGGGDDNPSTSITVTAGTPQTIFNTASSTLPYRIPSIVQCLDGKLIAIADYRYGRGDIGSGHIDIVGRSSNDNGFNWSTTTQTIAASNVNSTSNVLNYAHGDAATVSDSETGKLLLLCANGMTAYGSGGTILAKYYSDDEGLTWDQGTDITSTIKTLIGSSRQFFTSGRICQSKIIKVGQYYRIYTALCTNNGSYVVYSDDFGSTWKSLGCGYTGGDEAAVEELPDGSLLISARILGDTGRGFNVYKYSNTSTWNSGSWRTQIKSGITAAMCNGEVLLVSTQKEGLYVLLQSVPMSTSREKVGVYWKVIDTNTNADYTQPSFYNSFDGSLQISNTTSCYSTMTMQADGKVAFLYEDQSVNDGYNIKYLPLTVSLSEEEGGETSTAPTTGKLYTIKGRIQKSSTDVKYYYLKSSRESATGNLQTAITLVDANDLVGVAPTPEYYWVISEGPNYDHTPDASKNEPGTYYYISNYVGDGYFGYGTGYNYSTHETEENAGVACTNRYQDEFKIISFDPGKAAGTYGIKYWHRPGGSLITAPGGSTIPNTEYRRYISICYDAGRALNWFNYQSYGAAPTESGVYWSTDFIFEEVKPSSGQSTGSFDNPTEYGFKVNFYRSEDGKGEDYGETGTGDYNYYATVKLPFAFYLSEGMTAYTAAPFEAEHASIQLTAYQAINGIVPRETPVLLKLPGQEGDGVTNGKKEIYVQPAFATDIYFSHTGNSFKGVLGKEDISVLNNLTDDVWILGKKNGRVGFYRSTTTTIPANKAYILYTIPEESAAKGLSFTFLNEEVDAVKSVEINDGQITGAIYDLMGRKVTTPSKGIYIVNGKKVFIK